MFKRIDGWKTEIGLALLVVLRVAFKLDWIEESTYDWLLTGLIGWTGFAYRSAIAKSERSQAWRP